jgi:multiple sugar transport system permease protein
MADMVATQVVQARTIRRPLWNRRTQQLIGKALAYLFMSALCFVFLIPFYWLISTSLKLRSQVWSFPPQWIPNPVVWSNYTEVFRVSPFLLWVRNTLILVFWNILGSTLSNAAVAFPFARLRFPGRNFLFMLLISTMMIPGPVLMIPTFIMFKLIGWYNTYYPLIVPSFFGDAFFIFLLRQYMMTIPFELDDAARIDGCSRFQLWWRILLPLCVPPLTIVVVYNFMGSWNAFMGPLIYLNDSNKYPLGVGIAMFKNAFLNTTNWGLLMAASVMMVLPCLVVYYFAQDKLIGGIASVGLKG